MKYSDYQVIVEKEYEKNRKNIFTCYFFILLSVILFAVFFLSVRELPVAVPHFFWISRQQFTRSGLLRAFTRTGRCSMR